MRMRSPEPEQAQAAQLAAAASMGNVSNQALAAGAASGSPAALAELAKAAGGSQAAGALIGSATHPGVSAAGLGAIGEHGAKPSSNRSGPKVHRLESEHVIPFAVGARLWELIGLVAPKRNTRQDRKQTTIMIYEGAADLKTTVDNRVSAAFKAEFNASGLAADMSTAATFGQGGGGGGDMSAARAVLADLAAAMEEIRADAVGRTVEAVAAENEAVEAGYELSNGERRAVPPDREPPLPPAEDIEQASQTQYDDIINLATEAVERAGP